MTLINAFFQCSASQPPSGLNKLDLFLISQQFEISACGRIGIYFAMTLRNWQPN